MKNFVKILFLFLAFLLLFTEGQVLAVQNNLENASLIEKYLTSHKANIIEYATKYNFIDDKEIVDGLSKIDILISSLKKIQAKNNGSNEKAIGVILGELKKINTDLEASLKFKKYLYNKKLQSQKEIYVELGRQLGVQLDKLNSFIYPTIKNKTNLNDKEKKLKNSLEILVLLSKDVKTFNNKNFDTIEEMQSSFLSTLNSIKYYIVALRESMK